MRYPTPGECLNTPKTNEQKCSYLKKFREVIERDCQSLIDYFGEHQETREVITKLIEARMWSGNLLGYVGETDLNRKRDEDEEGEDQPVDPDEDEDEDEAGEGDVKE